MPTPGTVRPYTLADVLMTINDQVNQVQQSVSGSITGISVVAEDDEPAVTTSDTALAVAVTSPPVWGNTVWGSDAWS